METPFEVRSCSQLESGVTLKALSVSTSNEPRSSSKDLKQKQPDKIFRFYMFILTKLTNRTLVTVKQQGGSLACRLMKSAVYL